MAVSLVLHGGMPEHVRAWNSFIGFCHSQHPHTDWEQIAYEVYDQQLQNYGAWTNWEDSHDPIWFADQSHLMQFLLTWM